MTFRFRIVAQARHLFRELRRAQNAAERLQAASDQALGRRLRQLSELVAKEGLSLDVSWSDSTSSWDPLDPRSGAGFRLKEWKSLLQVVVVAANEIEQRSRPAIKTAAGP